VILHRTDCYLYTVSVVKSPSFLRKYFRIKGGESLLFGGMDSRFRGNDIKRSGNDPSEARLHGASRGKDGNDIKEIFKIILNSLLQLEEKWGKIGL